MQVIYTDGGRKAAGFKGLAGDCACRAAAIVTGKPYEEVYTALNQFAQREHPGARRRRGRRSTARSGVFRVTVDRYFKSLGWTWVPTMRIGAGCTVHLREGELPMGRLFVHVSRHYTAVIDGVIYDNHDPSRGGTRCVY